MGGTNSTSNSANFDQVVHNNYLPTMILSSYRFDSTSVLQDFPLEIIYIILDYFYTPIIEFECFERTVPECEKFHKGRKLPYSFQTSQNDSGRCLFFEV
jgi:hypothetical protein